MEKRLLAYPSLSAFFLSLACHIAFTDPQRSPQRLASEVCQTEEA